MSAFAKLHQMAATVSASTFAPGVAGTVRSAWFPGDEQEEPVTRADYVLMIRNVTGGSVRRAAGEALQTLMRADDTISILFADFLPYDPQRGKTTVLVGLTHATADRFRIVEYRRAAGIMEIDCQKITPPEG